jgi:hypothetical protein
VAAERAAVGSAQRDHVRRDHRHVDAEPDRAARVAVPARGDHPGGVYEGRDWVSGGYQQEVFGACRSFQPWAMLNVVKEAYNVDDAAEIAQLATDGPDGFYECPYGEWRLFSDQDVGRRRWAGACDEYLRIGDASVDRW